MRSVTIRERIGANFKALRSERQISAEAVAKEMKHLGFSWTVSRVSELEKGLKSVSIAELIGICFVLSKGSKSPIRLVQLFDGAENVQLTDVESTTTTNIVQLFSGEPISLAVSDYESASEKRNKLAWAMPDRARKATKEFTRYGGPYDFELIGNIVEAMGLADSKAAKALGITDMELAGASAKLWGNSLTVERDKRSVDQQKQAKGHITRKLIAELRDHIGKCNGDD